MQGDIIIRPVDAQAFQNLSRQNGNLLLWTVTSNTSDYPEKFTARPHSISRDEACPSRCLLVADTLAELRAMLPYGLAMLARQEEDEPVIVETWI